MQAALLEATLRTLKELGYAKTTTTEVVARAGYAPHEDFVPLGGFATFVNGLAVSPGTPAKSVQHPLTMVRRAYCI